MPELDARRKLIPLYATTDIPRRERQVKKNWKESRFLRQYGIAIVAACIYTLSIIITAARVEKRTETRVRQEMAIEYASKLEQYKAEQAKQVQAEYWLSGEASREAFVNQMIETGAHFIAEESGDKYKCTKLGVAIARTMNPGYPDSFQEVVEQDRQWIRSSMTSKITQHDLDLSEKLLRPYFEQGIIPNYLTDDMVFFNTDTGVARNTWEMGANTRTWEYQG